MLSREPSVSANTKNIAAEIRRSEATDVDTLLLKMYEMNNVGVGFGSPRNMTSGHHGAITPMIHSRK